MTVPIIIRSLLVNLSRLNKADDIHLTEDLIDYIHTPLPPGELEHEQSFTLDWWNDVSFPMGNEEPAEWMTFGTMGKIYKLDNLPPPEPKGQDILFEVPRRMFKLLDHWHPSNTRKLPEGYCRTCARLLEFVRILQQELKSLRNTFRGWETIFRHRATQAQIRASALYGVLQVLAEKEGAMADTNGGKGVELSSLVVQGILHSDMLFCEPTQALDLNSMSPTRPLSPMPTDAMAFSVQSEGARAPPSLATAECPDFFRFPPLGPDRNEVKLEDLPEGWKEGFEQAIQRFKDIEDECSTLDPATTVFADDGVLQELLDAMPAPQGTGTSISQGDRNQSTKGKAKFTPVVVSSSGSEMGGSIEKTAAAGAPRDIKTKFTPMTVSSSGSEGRQKDDAGAPHLLTVGTTKFAPMVISSDESDAEDTTAGTEDAAARSQFTPMVVSSGESDNGNMSDSQARKVKAEFIPFTLPDSDDEAENVKPANAPAGSKTPLFLPSSGESSICARSASGKVPGNDEDDDQMSVDLDALADRINNAPVYTNYSFSNIPDNVLEPGDSGDEDDSEGHEYEGSSEDGEYETEEEEDEQEH